MTTHISMLRGINVSGQKKIRMVELKSLYESLGLDHVTTYVQSGNVVFESSSDDESSLAGKIEACIEKNFGYSVSVFLRSPVDFKHLLTRNPFLNDRHEDPSRLYITFLYQEPKPGKLERLGMPAGESAEFVMAEREIFLYYPDGYGRTKFSNNYIERKLDIPATTRNWNTVNALFDLATRGG